MPKALECFYPGSSFPAISVTGRACSLDCKHCSRKYLEGMISATTNEELLAIGEALAERGANGFLLSGGVDASGRVPISELLPAIRELKATTDLKINAHIGLTPRNRIGDLVRSGIDAFSVDVYGSDDAVRDVLGVRASAQDYYDVLSNLKEANAPNISPHICIGIHEGNVKSEFNAIDSLRKFAPSKLVLISLMPTKGTAYEKIAPPSKEAMISVISKARDSLPGTKLLLGCMRSKRDRSWEHELVAAGLDGIVLPSAGTVDRLKKEGYSIKKRSVCCAIP